MGLVPEFFEFIVVFLRIHVVRLESILRLVVPTLGLLVLEALARSVFAAGVTALEVAIYGLID